MDWILTTLQWYFPLLIIGIIFTPLTKKIFKSFGFDLGYPFAKTLGILLLSYLLFVFGIVKILPFNRISLFLMIGIFALINFFIAKRHSVTSFPKIKVIVFEEILFLFSLLLWTFIRSQEPSIHSLEKFMDFGFINSILRADFFPPKDIWYTPEPINYYYFGHLTGALLIKLTNIKASIGYNLILATIFAQGTTQVFSLVTNIIKRYNQKLSQLKTIVYGLIGAYLINLGGNLHTIYLFTKGYSNETPIPFWKILSGFNPTVYWYPNATRFIPFTIHEFPSYSYVVADLHGHVFDIPFVLLTLAILFIMFTTVRKEKIKKLSRDVINHVSTFYSLIPAIFIGFMTAIHYMTNAFDGPIYILLTLIIFFLLYGVTLRLLVNAAVLIISFILFVLPFSNLLPSIIPFPSHFHPFVSGIGVNCSPKFLTDIGKIGPFLFEAGNCQISPLWMLFILWGFFWVSFIIFLIIKNKVSNNETTCLPAGKVKQLNNFLLILFSFGLFLTIIPEFFYIKDIYPAHFRANTMFKLGYQAFTMMGIASIITFYLLKNSKKTIINYLLTIIFIFFLFFPAIYPYFSVPSYYGQLNRSVELNGQFWLKQIYPEDNEIVDYLNKNEKEQPVILEAQGDSYTDYGRISAFTGLPTIAGWWVHEWLWRGSSDIVGKRIPEVVTLYESNSIDETKFLIKKYHIKYVIISRLERQKYPNLNEEKWSKIGKLIFKSSNSLGALYQVNQ